MYLVRKTLNLSDVLTGGKLVIINLQKTPKDKKASLVIHARCDAVMQAVMSKLGLSIPVYTRTDKVLLHCQQSVELRAQKPSMRSVALTICNAHDQNAALSLVKTASITIVKV